jgi:hypothetical protein
MEHEGLLPCPLDVILSQCNPVHPVFMRSCLILFSHIRLGLQSGPFYSGFPIKNLYAFLMYPVRATLTSCLIFIDLITAKTL